MSAMTKVVLLMGISGSGKSEIAKAVENKYGFVVISRDTIREGMFSRLRYAEWEKKAAFDALIVAVRAAVLANQSVVIDGMSFSRYGEFERVKRNVIGKARLIAIYCECAVEVAMMRVEQDLVQRKHPVPIRNRDMVFEMATRFRNVPRGVKRVRTDRIFEEVIADINGIIEFG